MIRPSSAVTTRVQKRVTFTLSLPHWHSITSWGLLTRGWGLRRLERIRCAVKKLMAGRASSIRKSANLRQ